MTSIIKKMERRIERLEKAICDLIPLAEMGTAHWQGSSKQIAKAKKLLGEIPDADTL